MNWNLRRGHAGIGAAISTAVVVLALLGPTTPAFAAVEAPTAADATDGLEGLSNEELALYESDDLKLIRLDASSGAVESVEPLTAEQLTQALASIHRWRMS